MNISKRSYGEYKGHNYGAHTLVITVNGTRFWFSYDTVVAFEGPNGLRVSENCWQQTTGKHLNWIDGGNKKSRLPSEQFEKELAELEVSLGVTL
jgi:hypothetical protein